jgi:hypothetical protein
MAARELRIPPSAAGGAGAGPAAASSSRSRVGSPAPGRGAGSVSMTARRAGPTVHPMERAISEIQTPEQSEALRRGEVAAGRNIER